MSDKEKKFVVVTTDNTRRGVFGGWLESHKADVAVLTQAQMCVKWVGTRGVVGLAAIGPQKGSRISPPVSRLEVNGVTCVMDCSDAARAGWEAQPWD